MNIVCFETERWQPHSDDDVTNFNGVDDDDDNNENGNGRRQ